jgi:hypothetical protein
MARPSPSGFSITLVVSNLTQFSCGGHRGGAGVTSTGIKHHGVLRRTPLFTQRIDAKVDAILMPVVLKAQTHNTLECGSQF